MKSSFYGFIFSICQFLSQNVIKGFVIKVFCTPTHATQLGATYWHSITSGSMLKNLISQYIFAHTRYRFLETYVGKWLYKVATHVLGC